jgi:hypothetical protein
MGTATFMRGMQDLLLDAALHPRFLRRLLEGTAGYILETMRIPFERFDFDGIVSATITADRRDDHRPRTWRSLVKPFIGEIYTLARRNGHTVATSRYHSRPDRDGAGHPAPHSTGGYGCVALKREFGRDLTFCGGLGTQSLLPRGNRRKCAG